MYLTDKNVNLLDIIKLDDKFKDFIEELLKINQDSFLVKILKKSKQIIKEKMPGYKTIMYLLFNLRWYILKEQISKHESGKLENLKLSNGVLMFEDFPFVCSLKKHNPSFEDLICCFEPSEYQEQILARIINNNINKNKLFIDINELKDSFDQEIKTLKDDFNKLLDSYSEKLKLEIYFEKYITIAQKLEEFQNIVNLIKEKNIKDLDYSTNLEKWIKDNNYHIDDVKKKEILLNGFAKSNILFISGPAGTGKTTLIKHFVEYFSDDKILFLANTHLTKENLKSKIPIKNGNYDFSTIKKYNNRNNDKFYKLIIIDECSIVSNEDIFNILSKNNYEKMILVGDPMQIESIKFGIWFNIIVKQKEDFNVYELDIIHRAKNNELLMNFWKK